MPAPTTITSASRAGVAPDAGAATGSGAALMSGAALRSGAGSRVGSAAGTGAASGAGAVSGSGTPEPWGAPPMALAPQAPARWRLVPGLPAPLVLEALALALLAQAPFGPSGLGAPAWAGWGFELALSVVPLSMLRRWSLEDLEGKRARSKGVCRTALGRCGLAGHREEPSEGSGRELHVLAATGSRFEAAHPGGTRLGRAHHGRARKERPTRTRLQQTRTGRAP